MTGRQEKRVQELIGEIEGNIRILHCGGFYEGFMQSQRRTWARIGRAADPVKRRVNEILEERRKS